jgi:hypothetical protein
MNVKINTAVRLACAPILLVAATAVALVYHAVRPCGRPGLAARCHKLAGRILDAI